MNVEGAQTVLRGSVMAPKGFCEGKPESGKPWRRSPQGFGAKGWQHSVGTRGTLLRVQFFLNAPKIFNSCSDYQNQEVHLPADWL